MKINGKIEVKNGLRIKVNLDFCRYYMWLVTKYHYNTQKYQLPMHGAHVTILNPKIHGKKKQIDFNKLKPFDGKTVEFEVYPKDAYVSKVNVWLPVKCDFADKLKKALGIVEDRNWWGSHITICNKKFN